MSFKINQIVELTIQSLAHGGAGVGRLNDFVFFVPYTAPEDKVLVQITEIKKNYAQAELKQILTPSKNRRQPPCEVYGQCGGCQWQHVEYQTQLEQKQKMVEHALSRIAKENAFEIKKIIPSPKEFNYRNRAQIRTQGPRLGFYSRSSHDLVRIKSCHLLEPLLNSKIEEISQKIKDYPNHKTSKIEIFATQDGKLAVSENREHSQDFGFSQVNTKQNENLQKLILEIFAAPSAPDESSILELFCGNGNFTFPLSQLGWDIYAIDLNKSAINQARAKATKNTFFSCSDCTKEVKKLGLKGRIFKTILLDPPRTGCDEALIKNLGPLKPEKIVYVSCNPATFARDWTRIKTLGPFKLKWVQPLDMFPQTFHVELVAVMELT